jgi:hypothetical protein
MSNHAEGKGKIRIFRSFKDRETVLSFDSGNTLQRLLKGVISISPTEPSQSLNSNCVEVENKEGIKIHSMPNGFGFVPIDSSIIATDDLNTFRQ